MATPLEPHRRLRGPLTTLLAASWLLLGAASAARGAQIDGAPEPAEAPADRPPDVLLIVVDDLNDWVGHLGGHPNGRTPNLDRLAERGISFTNAHCTAPACNPSRASLMSGMRPSTTGCYLNAQKWTKYVKEGLALNHHFRKSGYTTVAMGKIYHGHSNTGYESGWQW